MRRLPTARARAGFTMVEVLVTIAIMGLMLAGITQMLSSVRFTRDIIHNEQEQYLAGPAILDLIERDIQAIFVTGIPREAHLLVADRVVGGADADRIDFFTTTDSLIWHEDSGRPVRADVNEVGYCLRFNPSDDDFLELYRREGFGIDLDPHEGGRYIFLHDRIRGFNIEVFPERGPEDILEPVDEWGQDEGDTETSGLPAFLRVTLEIELEPRLLRETLLLSKQLKTYERIINLPEALRYGQPSQIPRLAIPTGGSDSGTPEVGPGGDEVDETTEVGGPATGGRGGGGGGGGSIDGGIRDE